MGQKESKMVLYYNRIRSSNPHDHFNVYFIMDSVINKHFKKD